MLEEHILQYRRHSGTCFILLEALRRLYKEQDFLVSIETLDDVVFNKTSEDQSCPN